MKAIIQPRYGSADVLRLQDVDKPKLEDDRVLVRVRASSVNATDWRSLRGKPYAARPMMGGIRRPKSSAVGVDAAGIVEAVGKDVTHVASGDEVYGMRNGAFAEYVSGRTFVPKPANLSFEQAAAVPVAAGTALIALRDKGAIQAGQRVLITGAGGGRGHVRGAAGQGLRRRRDGRHQRGQPGARPVDRRGPGDRLRALGLHPAPRALRPGRGCSRAAIPARYPAGPGSRRQPRAGRAGKGDWIGPLTRFVAGTVRSRLLKQRIVGFYAQVTREHLLVLKELIEAGKVTPVIDRTYPLSEAAEAIRYVEPGRAKGKVVITV